MNIDTRARLTLFLVFVAILAGILQGLHDAIPATLSIFGVN